MADFDYFGGEGNQREDKKKNEFIYHLIQTTSYSRECCVIKYYSVINLAATKKVLMCYVIVKCAISYK